MVMEEQAMRPASMHPALALDWPPHPARTEPLLTPGTTAVALVRAGGAPPAGEPAPPLSVPALAEHELAAPPATLLEEDVLQRLFSSSFRERLAATAQLEPWHVASGDEFCAVLRACASLGRRWASENNVQVASTGLRFLHVQLRVFLDYRRAEPGGSPTRGDLHDWVQAAHPGEWSRALASICSAAAARLTDRKSTTVARDILHAAVELHSLRFVLAATIEPFASAAVASPAAAAAAMAWLSDALQRWKPAFVGRIDGTEFQDSRVPGAAIACCAAALRSPAEHTRTAALSALVALDRHCPVLEAIAAPEHGCSQSVVSTVRTELSKHPPPRVVPSPCCTTYMAHIYIHIAYIQISHTSFTDQVFQRAPRDFAGREPPRHESPSNHAQPPQEAWRPDSAALGHPGTAQLEAPLEFSSDFECGNLHQAAMVDRREYELWLERDTNVPTHRLHTQWFFFRVRGMVRFPRNPCEFQGPNCFDGDSF